MGEKVPGVPLVFFDHGLGGNSLDFSWVQRNISTMTKTCSFDRAGYGNSAEAGQLPRQSSQIASETKILMDALGFDHVVYVGHSFAGFNSRILNSISPGVIRGIVYIDAVNPNDTRDCDASQDYPSPLFQFGLATSETGLFRLLNLIGFIDGFAPISKLPPDVQSEYRANIMRAGYFRTRVDEYMEWGRSCSSVKALNDVLNVPLIHIYPSGGIHSDNLTYAVELAELSPQGKAIEITEEDADHVSILFDSKFAAHISQAVVDVMSQV